MVCWCFQAASSNPSESGFKAKLCFAHAETIIPLVCLLGLFGRPSPAADPSMAALAEHCSLADVQGNVQGSVQGSVTSSYGQPEVLSEPVLQQPVINECGISSNTDSGMASSTDNNSSSSSNNSVNSSGNTGTCSSSNASTRSTSSSSSNSGRHCNNRFETCSELIQEGDDQEGQAWVPPLPRPPLSRDWFGSMIAPYGANIQFALHKRTDTEVSGRCLLCFNGMSHCSHRKHSSMYLDGVVCHELLLAVQQVKVGGTLGHVQDQDKLFDHDSKQPQT